MSMQLNGDTGANYSWHLLEGGGSSVISAAGSSTNYMRVGVMPGSSGTLNAFGGAIIDILDAYSTNKNKTARSLSGNASNATFIDLLSGSWINTNSLTSITLAPAFGGDFSIGSRFSLYGVTA